jgi:hypothetical protein
VVSQGGTRFFAVRARRLELWPSAMRGLARDGEVSPLTDCGFSKRLRGVAGAELVAFASSAADISGVNGRNGLIAVIRARFVPFTFQ